MKYPDYSGLSQNRHSCLILLSINSFLIALVESLLYHNIYHLMTYISMMDDFIHIAHSYSPLI